MDYMLEDYYGFLFFFLQPFQLRYLQTLNSIAAEQNSTIIFPMPMNIFSHFLFKKEKPEDKMCWALWTFWEKKASISPWRHRPGWWWRRRRILNGDCQKQKIELQDLLLLVLQHVYQQKKVNTSFSPPFFVKMKHDRKTKFWYLFCTSRSPWIVAPQWGVSSFFVDMLYTTKHIYIERKWSEMCAILPFFFKKKDPLCVFKVSKRNV